ncbi:cytochrome P450 [Litorimonas sp. RW-G-Af-16]|uniref:cytochrome P450 n=1 Tax=Litorimonas sp. RW-G-Af-16 TaxID=3241168 RepID=UPI00390C9F33
MGLDLVSANALEDRGAREPVNPPVFDIKPPLNLGTAANFTNGQPFDAFKIMRETAPVMWHSLSGKNLEGFWALTRYEDVRAANLDTKTFSSQKGGIMMAYPSDDRRHPQLHSASLDTMICLDAPHHMQLRREHMAYFTPGYVRDLKVKVDAKISELLDDMATQAVDNKVDMVEVFSSQLPLFTLCEMLGIPEADRPKIREWMNMLELAQYILESSDFTNVDPAQVMQFMSGVQDMFAYGRAALLDRRANPRQDLLSAIANVEIDGAKLPDEFLDGSWLLIVIAGNDTTRNSLSGTMKLLTEFPQAKADLMVDPELIPNMVHEAVRMVSPVMYMRRTATQDTQIGAQKIAEGEKVILYYGAANRDPEKFESPDVFDIRRANAKEHIAFGTGPHVCLGQRVANMQLEAAYRQILARYPNISWTGEQEILPNGFTHSIGKLIVDLG